VQHQLARVDILNKVVSSKHRKCQTDPTPSREGETPTQKRKENFTDLLGINENL